MTVGSVPTSISNKGSTVILTSRLSEIPDAQGGGDHPLILPGSWLTVACFVYHEPDLLFFENRAHEILFYLYRGDITAIQMFLQVCLFNFPLPSQVRSMILIQRMYYQLLHHGAILKFKEYKATKEPIFYVPCLQGYSLHTFTWNPCRYQYCIVYPAFWGVCEAFVNVNVIIHYQISIIIITYVYIVLYRLCMYDSLSADFLLLGPGRIAI